MLIPSSRKVSLFISLIIGVICCGLLACQVFLSQSGPDDAVHAQSVGRPHGARMSYLLEHRLGGNWERYTQEKVRVIEAWEPSSVKIIFLVSSRHPEEFYCLAAKKRARSKKKRRDSAKHRHLEFPGGRVDDEESPVLSLQRELYEEDHSSVLGRLLKQELRNESGEIYFRNLRLKNGEPHTIFSMPLSSKDWEDLRTYWSDRKRSREVYGYSLISVDELNQSKKELQLSWTPKTVKILRTIFRR